MSLVEETIWFIESHYAEAITLEQIADVVGVSPYHLVRAFGSATGYPVMRYVRARRLSIAAQLLASDDSSILDTALEAGYGSQEAFTRAFRDQFGVTPGSIRKQQHVNNINLLEPISIQSGSHPTLEPPRIETHRRFLVAGLTVAYGDEHISQHIPAQWQEFAPYINAMSRKVCETTYGVCYGSENGTMVYLCGIEIDDSRELPPELSSMCIEEAQYAVFTHRNHVATLSSTWQALLNEWYPASGYDILDAPSFERYDRRFDPVSGKGEMELWIPVQKS